MAKRAKKRTITDSALDHVFFVLGGTATVWLAFLLVGESFRWAGASSGSPGVLGAPRLPGAAAAAPDPHRDLRARLLHRPRPHERRAAGRPGQPRPAGHRGPDPRGDGRGGLDAWPTTCRSASGLAHRRVDAHAAQLRRGAGEPAVPLRPAAGLRLPAGGGRQPRPSATTCGSGGAPTGWLLPGGSAVDWLAAGTFDRSVGLSLFTLQITHKIDADTDVERDHIVATRDRGRPAGVGRTSSRTSPPATTPATAAATRSPPTATCRSSTSGGSPPIRPSGPVVRTPARRFPPPLWSAASWSWPGRRSPCFWSRSCWAPPRSSPT